MPPLPPTIEGCHSLIKELYNIVLVLQQKVEVLEGRVNQTSVNSHRPPSSDGLSKPPTVHRPKVGKVGGQKGHSGKTLKMVSNPDHIEQHRPHTCQRCGNDLKDLPMSVYERRQVFELPTPRLVVTENQAFSCTCGCGIRNLAPFPSSVNAPVQYGHQAKAFASLLNQQYLMPFEKVSDLFEDLFSQPINGSTVISGNKALYDALEVPEQEIKKAIEQSEVAHFDETGIHINSHLHWLHVACTDKLTYYFVHAKRGTPALVDTPSVLCHFKGRAIHDCWTSYFKFDNCSHGLCNAHLMRELQAAAENGFLWAITLQNYLKELLELKYQNLLTTKFYKKSRKKIERVLDKILKKRQKQLDDLIPISKTQQKVFALVKRMKVHLSEFLAFAEHQKIPFSNNQAERDIRMVKLKAKISGGFRTPDGAHIFARIRGYISTLKKQNINIFQQLANVLSHKTLVPICAK